MRMGRNTWIYNIVASRFFLVIGLAFVVCSNAKAATDITYYTLSPPWDANARSATHLDACKTYNPNTNATYRYSGGCYRTIWGSESFVGYVVAHNETCPFGNTGLVCNSTPSVPPGQPCEGPIISDAGNITNAAGQCVDFWDADTPSQCKSLGGTTRVKSLYIQFDSDGNPQMPPPVNAGGCETLPIDVSHCVMAPKRVFSTGGTIQPTSNKCKIGVSFTGNTIGPAPVSPPRRTAPGDDGLCMGDCPDIPPAPIENDTKPCTYVYDGEGRKVCSSSNFNYSPGNSSCGSVDGKFQCIGKAPTTNGIVIDTTVTDTTNADGSKTSVKKDTATQITCNNPKPCVSNVTTNTTTTTYNSNGAKTGQSTSCTGDACSSGGKGDSDGDGLSDCVVGQCEEEEGEFTGPENDDVGSFGDSLDAFMADVQGAPIIARVSAISVPTGGSCSFQPMVVPILGTLSLQPMCSWAVDWFAPLRYLMLAIWAIVAVRTFMEA